MKEVHQIVRWTLDPGSLYPYPLPLTNNTSSSTNTNCTSTNTSTPTMITPLDNNEIVVDIHNDSNQQLILQELQVQSGQGGLGLDQLKLDEMEAIEEFDVDGPFRSSSTPAADAATATYPAHTTSAVCHPLSYFDYSNQDNINNEIESFESFESDEGGLTQMDIDNWPDNWSSLNISDIEKVCSLDDLFLSWSKSLPDMVMPTTTSDDDLSPLPSLQTILSLTNVAISEIEGLGLDSLDSIELEEDEELQGIKAVVASYATSEENSLTPTTPKILAAAAPVQLKKVWIQKCKVCGTKLQGGRQRIEAHMHNCHKWMCDCGIEYLFKQTLTKHIQNEAKAAALIASDPSTSTTTTTTTTTKEVHGIRKPQFVKPLFECDMCDGVFRTSTMATKHRKTVHLIIDEVELNPKKECQFCQETFSVVRRLHRHEKSCPANDIEKAGAEVTDVDIDVNIDDTSKPSTIATNPKHISASNKRAGRRKDIGIKKAPVSSTNSTTSSNLKPIRCKKVRKLKTVDQKSIKPLEMKPLPKVELVTSDALMTTSSNSSEVTSSTNTNVGKSFVQDAGAEDCFKSMKLETLLCQSTTADTIASSSWSEVSKITTELENENLEMMKLTISQGFKVLRRGTEFSGLKPLLCSICRRDYFCKKSLRFHIKKVHNITTDYLSYIIIQNPELIRLIPTKGKRTEVADADTVENIHAKIDRSAQKRKKGPGDETVTSSSDLKDSDCSRNKSLKLASDLDVVEKPPTASHAVATRKTKTVHTGRKGKCYPPEMLKSILVSAAGNSSTSTNIELKTLKHGVIRVNKKSSPNKHATVNVVNSPILKELSKSGAVQPQVNSGRFVYILSPVTTPNKNNSRTSTSNSKKVLSLPAFEELCKNSTKTTVNSPTVKYVIPKLQNKSAAAVRSSVQAPQKDKKDMATFTVKLKAIGNGVKIEAPGLEKSINAATTNLPIVPNAAKSSSKFETVSTPIADLPTLPNARKSSMLEDALAVETNLPMLWNAANAYNSSISISSNAQALVTTLPKLQKNAAANPNINEDELSSSLILKRRLQAGAGNSSTSTAQYICTNKTKDAIEPPNPTENLVPSTIMKSNNNNSNTTTPGSIVSNTHMQSSASSKIYLSLAHQH